jgi:Domain of unknown function (DUF4234)
MYHAKRRSPWGVAFLPYITFGIYFLVWYYRINQEMAELGRSRQDTRLGRSPGTSVIAVSVGALLIVPAVWSLVNTFKRIQVTQRIAGAQPITGWIGVVLGIFVGPALHAYMQIGLNDAWDAFATTSQVPATSV